MSEIHLVIPEGCTLVQAEKLLRRRMIERLMSEESFHFGRVAARLRVHRNTLTRIIDEAGISNPERAAREKRRPKRVIVCVGVDEVKLSQRVFVLETRLYRVLRATSADQALELLAGMEADAVDLLLVEIPLRGLVELLRRAKAMRPGLPVMVTGAAALSGEELGANVALRVDASAAEMLEWVKILVARHLGPKALRAVLDASRENEAKKPVVKSLPPFGSKSKRGAA